MKPEKERLKKNFAAASTMFDEREVVADRYDPVALMFKERTIIVAGEVNAQLSYNIIAQLKKLEYLDPDTEIQMIVNSPGGSVIEGMAIYDVMRQIKCPIKTIGVGMQASMGSILLSAGDQRVMSKNSSLMIHQISSQAKGQATDLEIGVDFSERLHETLKNVYVRHTGLNHAFWDIVMERDTWLTAEQALQMGFINAIVAEGVGKAAQYEKDSIRPEFQAAKEAKVPKSAEEITAIINNVNARQGETGRIRPELVTALSQYPQFWTAGKKAEVAAKAEFAAAVNDDAEASATPVKRKKAAPMGPAV